MTDASDLSSRLKAYLSTLPLATQCRLVREIDRAAEAGRAEPAHALIRNLMRDVLAAGERAGAAPRMFALPFEPFVADDAGDRKHRGWIARGSLDAVWRWVTDQPGHEEVAGKAREAQAALLAGDHDRALALGAEMRRLATPLVAGAVEIAGDGRGRMQMAAQLGGNRAVEDLQDIGALLHLETRLIEFAASLPPSIENLSPEMARKLIVALKGDGADAVYLLMVLYRRLAVPPHILRLLVTAGGTDDGGKLARHPLAVTVDIVLADLDMALQSMVRHVAPGGDFDAVIASIKHFYSLASGLSVAIDVEGSVEWRTRLAEQRKRASGVISSEVARIPGAIRRALKPRQAEAGRIVAPDGEDVADALRAARLMSALRPYRSELAVNEILGGVIRQVETFVEAANAGIVKDVRTAAPEHKATARAMFEAAIALNSVIFGEDYATVIRRGARLDKENGQTEAPAA